MSSKLKNVIAIASLILSVQTTFGMDVSKPKAPEHEEKVPLDVLPKDVHKYMHQYLGSHDKESARKAIGNVPRRSQLARPEGTLPVAILSCPTFRELNEGLPSLVGQEDKGWVDSKGNRWSLHGHLSMLGNIRQDPLNYLLQAIVTQDSLHCYYKTDTYFTTLRVSRQIPQRINQPNIDPQMCRAAEPNEREGFLARQAGNVGGEIHQIPETKGTLFTSYISTEKHYTLPDGFKIECMQVMPVPQVHPQP